MVQAVIVTGAACRDKDQSCGTGVPSKAVHFIDDVTAELACGPPKLTPQTALVLDAIHDRHDICNRPVGES